MRILHVIPTYVPAYRYGGPMRSVHGLAEAQAAAGDRVAVFTTDADGPGRLDLPTETPVTVGAHEARYFRARFPRRIGRAPGLRRALRSEVGSFDLIHLHSVFLWPTAVAARVASSMGRRYVVSPRGMLVRELIERKGTLRKRLWLALVERRTLAESARIVVTSAIEAQEIRALGLDLASMVEVPNGVDLEELRNSSANGVSQEIEQAIASGPYALFLGRLSWKKGVGLAIRALAQVSEGRLVIAGPDDERLRPGLERLAGEVGVGERVTFLGELRGPNRVAILRSARVAVLASASENFGNAILEALACGVPAVVTPGVGLAAAVEAASAGWVVEAEVEPLATALREALGEASVAREAGSRGRVLVETSYTWEAVARCMRAVYEKVLAA